MCRVLRIRCFHVIKLRQVRGWFQADPVHSDWYHSIRNARITFPTRFEGDSIIFGEINLSLTTLEASFPFHKLSYELLHGTIEFAMLELGCVRILGISGSDLIFSFFFA